MSDSHDNDVLDADIPSHHSPEKQHQLVILLLLRRSSSSSSFILLAAKVVNVCFTATCWLALWNSLLGV